MKHAEIRSMLGSQIGDLIAQPGNLPLTLRPFQIETLESTMRWLMDPDGTRRAYVNHATGLGKTVVFASMIAALSGLRSLIVVPTKTLLEQTARVIAKFTGGMLGHVSSLSNIQDEVGETVAVRGLNHSSVVLTTDASFNKLAATIKKEFDPQLVLRDECHWGYIGPALAALEQFSEAVIIGFSATPDYLTNTPKGGYVPVKLENGQTLYGPRDRFAETHFQTCLDRRPVRWGIENGWLCPLAWGTIEFDVSLKDIPVVEGPDGPDYDESKLQELMGKHWPVMCETVRRLYENGEYDLAHRQVYAICPSVKAAQRLSEAIGSLGVSSAVVTGDTPDIERNIVLQAYRDNQISFLASVMVLREGWDAPDAEVCMMLRPTKSRVLYEQGIGRSLRLPEYNEHKIALVLDGYYQGGDFAPLSAPALFGKLGEEIPVGGFLIKGGGWNQGGENCESPFLPKNAKPKLVIVEMYEWNKQALETLPEADKGMIIFQGEEWVHRFAASKKLKVSSYTIGLKTATGNIRAIEGFSAGKIRTFYSLNDLATACNKITSALPRADHTGTFVADGRVWTTISAVALKLELSEFTVRDRVKKAPVLAKREGKDVSGQIVDFYLVEEVNETCSDLLKDVPKADKDDTFLIDGEIWCTATRGKRLLGLKHTKPLLKRIALSALRFREGRIKKGSIERIYPLEKIKEICSDLLPGALPVSDGGVLLINDDEWANATALRGLFNVPQGTMRGMLYDHNIRTLKAKGGRGRIATYYSVTDVKRILEEKLNLPSEKKRRN